MKPSHSYTPSVRSVERLKEHANSPQESQEPGSFCKLAVGFALFQATGYFTSPSPGTSYSSHLGLNPLLVTVLLLPEPGALVCHPGPSAGAARAPGEPRVQFLTSWCPLLEDALPPPRLSPASRTWRSVPPAQREGKTRQNREEIAGGCFGKAWTRSCQSCPPAVVTLGINAAFSRAKPPVYACLQPFKEVFINLVMTAYLETEV